MKWWVAYLCCLVCGGLALIVYGCGTTLPSQNGDTANPNQTLTGPCSPNGLTHACHNVTGETQGILNCAQGTQTCENGAWGPCGGTSGGTGSVSGRAFNGAVGGDLHTQATGPSPDAGGCSSDPCDPYCNGIDDNPDAGDAGCATAVVQAAAGPFTSFLGALAAGLQGNPTPCTAGPPDDCNYDSQCVLAACLPRTTGSTNTSCPAQPDFTLTAGCYDSSDNWNITVCNRGGVAATTGNLYVSIQTGSPTGAVGSCPFPTGNAVTIPGGGNNAGECILNLALAPLASGQCMTFVPATLTSGSSPVSCQSQSGGQITDWSGTHYLFVNPQSTALLNPLGAGEPLAECDTCNNYTAVQNTLIGKLFAACVPIGAGGGCAGGGSGVVGGNYGGLPGGFQQNETPCKGADHAADGGISLYGDPNQNPTATKNDCSQGDQCCPIPATGVDADDDDCQPWQGNQGLGTCVPPPGCNGPDFTMGTGCTLGGGDHVFPVCNRGTQPATSGLLRLGLGSGTSTGGEAACITTGGGLCNTEGKGFCDIDLSVIPLAVQTCVDIDIDTPITGVTCSGINSSGNRPAFINEGCPPAAGEPLAECDPCNNWSAFKSANSCSLIGAPPPPTSQSFTYTAVCPAGTHPYWNQFAYVVQNSANGTVTFTATTTPLAQDGGIGTPTAGPFTIATVPTSPATCPMTGPSPCPINLDGADGGAGVFPLPADSNEVLTLSIAVTSTNVPSPNASSWQINYDCIPSE